MFHQGFDLDVARVAAEGPGGELERRRAASRDLISMHGGEELARWGERPARARDTHRYTALISFHSRTLAERMVVEEEGGRWEDGGATGVISLSKL